MKLKQPKKWYKEMITREIDLENLRLCQECHGVMFVRVPGKCKHWRPCPKCNKEM
jgi:hypothetical protein